jgi:hypothetical protein
MLAFYEIQQKSLTSLITECMMDPLFDAGPGSQYFSVGINHGGYFVGTGSNMSYVDGSIIHYDYLDTMTWSPTMVENIVEEIGMKCRVELRYTTFFQFSQCKGMA